MLGFGWPLSLSTAWLLYTRQDSLVGHVLLLGIIVQGVCSCWSLPCCNVSLCENLPLCEQCPMRELAPLHVRGGGSPQLCDIPCHLDLRWLLWAIAEINNSGPTVVHWLLFMLLFHAHNIREPWLGLAEINTSVQADVHWSSLPAYAGSDLDPAWFSDVYVPCLSLWVAYRSVNIFFCTPHSCLTNNYPLSYSLHSLTLRSQVPWWI